MSTPMRNEVYILRVTTLSPLHIGSGSSLAANIDYYVDGETTYVVDSDAALELVAQHWRERREPYEETLRRYQAELEREEQAILQADVRLKARIKQFDANLPRSPVEYQRQADRLRQEAQQIKERKQRLAERRDTPPPPPADELPDELVNGSTLDQLISTGLLPIEDLRSGATVEGRALVRYTLNGAPPGASEIAEQIKDVAGRAYIPGSSLKGAIRTALAWAFAPQPLEINQARSNKIADDRIERATFLARPQGTQREGNDAVRDALRLLQVGDTNAVGGPFDLAAVRVINSASVRAPLYVEVIPAGKEIHATLRLERYPLVSEAGHARLDFGDWERRLTVDNIAECCRRKTLMLIDGELAFFRERPSDGAIVRFYKELRDKVIGLSPRSFLLPVGWGASWRSKTLDDRLRGGAIEDDFAQAVRDFKLKKHKSGHFTAGGSFPDTRKAVLSGDRTIAPLGWLHVVIEEG